MHTFNTPLVSKKMITHNVVELSIKKPTDFDFAAGQFIQIMVPNGDNPAPRAYSICSTPADDHILLCVKLLDEGLGSNYIRGLEPGDDMNVRGPQGRFTLEQDVPLLCIATGAGIAPIISVIKDHLENKKTQHTVNLIFGVRSQEDMFWEDEFKRLKNEYTNFSYTITLSRPQDGWDGHTGRVTAHLDSYSDDTHAYVCGSPGMVKDVRALLVDGGMEATQIHFEIF